MSFRFPTSSQADLEVRASLWTRRVTIGVTLLAILLGALQAWSARFAMNPDGIQYLDNASLYWSGDFRHAMNTQWSPLYPWVIGALFKAVHPGPYQEFPLVHLLNFLLYLASLTSFQFFTNALIGRLPFSKHSVRGVSLLLVSYSAFIYCSLDFTNLAYVTPDLLVSIFAFLTAGYLLRIATAPAGLLQYLALGLVLGFGYLAKAPFLLFALLCIGILFVIARSPIRVTVATAAFALVCAPYVIALSNAKGRFTFGDSGRFNLIWMVNGVPWYHWQGGPHDNGTPVHPTRHVLTNPDIYEFATPVAGTYPPWYDPTYWDDGAHVALRPGDFARALFTQIRLYAYWIVHRQLPLLFGLLWLWLLAPASWSSWKGFWPVLLFAAAPFAMYAMVHAESRYLAPFFVLLWAVLFAGLLVSSEKIDTRYLLATVSVIGVLMTIEALAAGSDDKHLPPRRQYEIAQYLEGAGLKRGDPVAIFTSDLPYDWARLTGARITLEVTLPAQLCAACAQRQVEWERAKAVLAARGAKFVIAPCFSGIVDQSGWRQIGSTEAFAFRFD